VLKSRRKTQFSPTDRGGGGGGAIFPQSLLAEYLHNYLTQLVHFKTSLNWVRVYVFA
jgi:hypothetical protein